MVEEYTFTISAEALIPIGVLKKKFAIKKVHFNDPATVVIWEDGTKTVVKCGEEDIYDPQTGLLMCIAKKTYGNNGKFNDILREWVPEEVEEESNILEKMGFPKSHTLDFDTFAKLISGGKADA